MSFIKYSDNFKVETLENGIIDEFGDKIYSYKIVSKLTFNEVRDFCMKELQISHHIDKKPNPFAPELVKFKFIDKISDEIGSLYSYKVRKPSTA